MRDARWGRVVGGLIALLGAVSLCAPAQAEVRFDRAFGVGVDTGTAVFESCTTASTCEDGLPEGIAGAANTPHGAAIDAQGRLLVVEQAGHRVSRYVIADDGTVTFDRAFGIGVDTGAPVLENCTAASVCQAGSPSPAAGGLDGPYDVAVDASGRLYVADENNHRVSRFAVAGDGTVSFDRAFGIGVDTGSATAFENCTAASTCQPGVVTNAAGGIRQPQTLAFDASGRLYVGGVGQRRLSRFTIAGDGTVSFDRAFGIGVDTGAAVFESCTTASTCQGGLNSTAAGGFAALVTALAVDPQGRLLVGDTNARVQRFTVDGGGLLTFDRAFGTGVDTGSLTAFENCTAASGCQSGLLAPDAGSVDPNGIAFDDKGRILVTSYSRNRVDRFTVAANGVVSFDRAFGAGVGTGAAVFQTCTTASTCQTGVGNPVAGGIVSPGEVAIDRAGRIIATSRSLNRVNVYVPGPGVRVTRVVIPAADTGTFDLDVGGALQGAAAGGSTSRRYFDTGDDVAVASTPTDPASYISTIDCGNGPQPGTSTTLTNLTTDTSCTITHARKAGEIGVATTAQTVAESAGQAVVQITRTGPTTTPASAHYAAASGTATLGADFAAAEGDVTFAAGAATATVTVPILDDSAVEPTETFTVRLSMPSPGATLGTTATTVTITDDDREPAATLPSPPPPSPPADTPPAQAATATPAAPIALACDSLAIRLLDVHLTGRRVAVAGIALPAYAGQTVTITASSSRAQGGTAVVQPDGTFATTLTAPSASIRKTVRYTAKIAGRTAESLKLVRQFVIVKTKRTARGLQVTAHVEGAKRGAKVTLLRQVTCTKTASAITAKVGANGNFTAVLPGPRAGATDDTVLYRAMTKFRGGTTYTLPIIVRR
jgi:hypothetical protein